MSADAPLKQEPPDGTRVGPIDLALFVVVAAELVFVGSLLWRHISSTRAIYEHAITSAANHDLVRQGVTLSFARALDFAIIKSAAVFLGFGLVLIGALYVLKVTNAAFQLNAETPDRSRVSLQSTSAGLVLATLGVAVVILALFSRSDVSLSGSWAGLDSRVTTAASRLPSEKREESKPEEDPTPVGVREEQDKQATRGSAKSSSKTLPDPLRGQPAELRVHFASGSVELSTAESEKLRAVAAALNAGVLQSVLVEGYGDAGVQEQLSLVLGDRRAKEVRELVIQYGGQSGSIRTMSYGEERPFDNESAEKGGDAILHLTYSR